jgi:xanthine/uracil permease
MKKRLKVLATGAVIASYGAALMWRGVFQYHNVYAMTVFSPAVIATGVFICGLALLPLSLVKRISRQKNRDGSHCGLSD